VEHFLLRQPRTRGFGAVILGRDPKLGARENEDEDRKQACKHTERKQRRAAPPAREDILRARDHRENPEHERRAGRPCVGLDSVEIQCDLDGEADDFGYGIGGGEEHRERDRELCFPEQSRREQTGADQERDLRERHGERPEIDGARETRAQHAAGEPERQAREHQRDVLSDRDAEVERAHRQEKRKARAGEEILLETVPQHGGFGSRFHLSRAPRSRRSARGAASRRYQISRFARRFSRHRRPSPAPSARRRTTRGM